MRLAFSHESWDACVGDQEPKWRHGEGSPYWNCMHKILICKFISSINITPIIFIFLYFSVQVGPIPDETSIQFGVLGGVWGDRSGDGGNQLEFNISVQVGSIPDASGVQFGILGRLWR